MELTLYRVYFKEGTQGTLFYKTQFLCFTIELPWRFNERNVSCIPEGRYPLVTRYSSKRSHHIHVTDVENRSLILIHPANHALEELQGCIAPVTYLSGIGTGVYSRKAFQKVFSLVDQALHRKETVILTLTSRNHEINRPL